MCTKERPREMHTNRNVGHAYAFYRLMHSIESWPIRKLNGVWCTIGLDWAEVT